MSPASYGISVALHATVLSIAGVAGVAIIRRPQARATAILILLLILCVAPWVLPVLRNRAPVGAVAKPSAAAREVPEQRGPVIVRLPVWTIASLPVESSPALPQAGPPKDAASPVATVKPATSAPAPFSASRLYVSAAWLWLAGSAVGIVWLLGSGLRLGLWLRGLPGLSDEQWLLIRRHLGGVEIPRSVFRIAADGRGPCVGGIFRPRIVLPLALIGEQALAQQLRWTLAHEICHWRHGDSRWIWVIALTRSLYWWNPIVPLLAGRWTAAREQVCDLQAGEDERTGYSSFLVAMASRASRSGGGLAVTMVRRQRTRSLRRRIVALLNASPTDLLPAGHGFKLAMAGGLGALAVVLSGITIAEGAKPAGKATVQEETQENEKDEGIRSPPAAAEIPPPPAPALRGDPNRLSKLNFAVVYSNHDITGGQRVIPALEYEALRTKIYSDPSNIVAASIPAMAIRENGEKGRMEFIREVIRPKAKDAGKKILGWQINPAVVRENGRVTLTMKATYGYAAGHAFGTPDLQRIRWPEPLDDIQSASGESSAVVDPDDILVTSLGMLDKDCYAAVFTKALEIDATGRPITASPLPPEQELTEKVRLTGEISTFPLSKHQKAYLAEVKGLLPQPSESMDRAVLPADSRDGDLPAGVPFYPGGQPCIAGIIPPSSWKPFSGATGAKEVLGPVEVVSGKRLKPWKQLDLELAVRLQRSFLGDELALQLRPETFGATWPGVPGQVWVIELKPLKAGTRRLLTLTAEKAQ